MKKIFISLMIIIIPLFSYAKEYVNIAVKIDMEQDIILGLMEHRGEKKLFNFQLKDADYNDGHTVAIYKNWLPELPKGAGLRMHISYPDEFLVVTESNRTTVTDTGIQYEFDNPKEGMVLAFSDRWVKETVSYKGVDISTLFSEKNRKHSPAYFARIKELLDIYIERLGRYPYSSFSVVDVPYYAGHALTSLTFISESIVGMPFLTDVSLGHELVHQWVGVGVDYVRDDGNWAEGLTTYLADRLYAEMRGEGAEYRKNALKSYMAHSRQKEDGTCLMEFKYKKDRRAQAIGYSKGMMVFAMLESMLGREDFEKGIRTFLQRHMYKEATWDDMMTALEDVSGVSLGDFIDGWLGDTALAEFETANVKVNGGLSGYSVSFDIKNRHKWLEYPLDIVVRTETGDVRDVVYVNSETESVRIETESRPLKLIIDPEYKAARFLTERETPPSLHYLFSKYKKTVFVNPEERDKYKPLTASLENAEIVSDSENPSKHMDSILVFLGDRNRAFEKLYPAESFDGEFIVKGYKHPMGLDRMSYLLVSRDMQNISRNVRRITHYGKYSSLTLDGGQRYEKTVDDSDMGIHINLLNEKQGYRVTGLSIKEILAENTDKKVVYVGENHDRYEHHENQFHVVREMFEAGEDFAVGLEMFQRRFQKYLDAYISGEISQKEMLLKTEYYDRWRFDFRLYKRIMDYAKEKRIPLVALNLEREITKRVSSEGIGSLGEDIKEIPEDIEYTGGRYKEFLWKIFSMHSMGKKFEHFYEAQLLWDETMAESAYKYMRENPEKKMVILAGNGHVRFGEGIPDRLKRRSGDDYLMIVQGADFEPGIAHYILQPEEMEYEASPKIGVTVDETEDGLLVKAVTKGSIAESAGILKGDYIIKFDDWAINSLPTIRIGFLYAEREKTYTLKVLRDGKTLDLRVTF